MCLDTGHGAEGETFRRFSAQDTTGPGAKGGSRNSGRSWLRAFGSSRQRSLERSERGRGGRGGRGFFSVLSALCSSLCTPFLPWPRGCTKGQAPPRFESSAPHFVTSAEPLCFRAPPLPPKSRPSLCRGRPPRRASAGCTWRGVPSGKAPPS